MLFNNVSIAGLAHIDAPHTLTSKQINERLQPTYDRLGIRTDVLGDVAGIHARRMWDADMQASDAATLAARKAMTDAGITAGQVGLLVNTSVSRDYLEPSTASIVSGNLGVGEECVTFDVANACLAFINGMDIAARMIERGEVDYALVVDGETANLVYEKTLERMTSPDVTAQEFRDELAALTLGCGAAAMVMARAELVPDAPRYRGGVTRSATEWNTLCRGNLDRMVTDTRMLLIEGLKLAQKTFVAAMQALGWVVDELDQFVIHQVSLPHTQAFIKNFGIDPKKVMTIFGEHGNIGPASVPIVLSKLRELGRLKKGDRIALMGIGSGLNCSMAEVVW
ncbi:MULTISPECIES: 3-oxoacyl-ACP synthase III [Xanthomonas translucens group]|jgi:3-oxoacyl-[acyl-carrier-protein] synthase-3|uniref:3-oxoacyl-ACP synthase n=4 Tax=Xanthomonas translucens group TaxID=3390202 RepID=A0A109HFA4_XANCT|nr:3-oxoacyl-ACP synthase III [Xanthomonas translucens]EKU23625.1 3-oxoacyl-[acyl-carrier protein] synthase III [Xanthomonas translucens pv. graminis ART-Xtg29]KWV10886.1 3-oxoacyl-ACP synthase [Xanthomonas translucens]MCC8446223.1 3-oxoacyl-ACP synthase III [Xanthomonas translucens pv. translucens]MCT8285201.1 3-oxoacyl-ACP synthase III [Xanthomonas translucens pv. translucens]MCT8302859.1 3-oxoacyl-ACP synthase III [Xanthomonas translucens pv. translucens]